MCEPEILPKVIPYFKNRSKFVDVGASDGWYTYVAAKEMPSGSTIIGFEPVPWIFDKYKNHYVASWAPEDWFKNKTIHCYNQVVSDQSGIDTKFYKTKNHSGVMDPLLLLKKPEAFEESWDIPTTKLDDFLDPSEKGVLIKIDVEGGEDKVIKGGNYYFSNCVECYVFLELHNSYLLNKGVPPQTVVKYFTDRGYEKIKLGGHGRIEWYIFRKEIK
tara:strand:+ start:42325 stop:42972 length:648 start_codon:yes stop_codon:yes gene_type:complete